MEKKIKAFGDMMQEQGNRRASNNLEGTPQVGETQSDGSIYLELWLFWQRSRRYFLWACALSLMLLAGYHMQRFYHVHKVKKMQAAFLKAQTPESALAFANQYSQEPLAGIAFLALAKDALEKETYDKALQLYQRAMVALKGTLLVSRAQIGCATAQMQLGKIKEAQEVLKNIASSKAILETYRAEAYYMLALSDFDQKAYASCRTHIDAIEKLGHNTDFFKQKAFFLKKQLPANS